MQQIDYQINNKFRIYIHKTPLRSLLNAKAFESKRQRVLLKTYLRFVQNSLAFHLKRKSVFRRRLRSVKCTENSCQFED